MPTLRKSQDCVGPPTDAATPTPRGPPGGEPGTEMSLVLLGGSEDVGGQLVPPLPTDGRVVLPVAQLGMHRPGQLVHRDDCAIPREAGEEPANSIVHALRTERQCRFQDRPDLSQRCHIPPPGLSATGMSIGPSVFPRRL